MYSKEDLIKLSKVDIDQIDKSILVDVHDMSIDNYIPIENRIENFFEYIGNPYLFKSGNIAIRVQFKNNNKTLEDSLISLFSYRKNCT